MSTAKEGVSAGLAPRRFPYYSAPVHHPTPHCPAPASKASVRLNKALAQAGVCSRRAADAYVLAGRVSVNGQKAEPGTKVVPGRDTVLVDGSPVALHIASPQAGLPVYMLNKPVEVVTTAKDPQGRPTVVDILRKAGLEMRLFPVGRLDYFSEGLLLLTSDGELANRLMHPRWHLPKLYQVTVRGEVSEPALEAMRSGMTLAEGERLAPVTASVTGRTPRSCVIEMELIQGVNRQIRRMCRDLKLTILKLVRVAQGPVRLGGLAPGAYRILTPAELRALRQAVDLT